jgi:hypothetical protein
LNFRFKEFSEVRCQEYHLAYKDSPYKGCA